MTVDRNVLTIIYRYIHDSFTRDLIVEYHSRVTLECAECYDIVCDYCILFNGWKYNYRFLDSLYMQREIFNFYGKKVVHNDKVLNVPINY